MKKVIALGIGLTSLLLFGNPEEKNLRFYASFDKGPAPEIALDGSGIRNAGEIPLVEGKIGKALCFASKDKPGDLLYNTGKILAGNEWSIAMWFKLDASGASGYGTQGPGRGLFRTNLGWEDGNAFASFDKWGGFNFTHFSGDKKYCGAKMHSNAFPGNKWIHIVFTYKDGKHAVYINGNEAVYIHNKDIAVLPPPMNVLRIGSMDFRSGDQLNGAIDELKLFNKALSADEAKMIMDSFPGAQKKTKVVAYIPFNGEVDGFGFSSFSASEVVFEKGKSGEGVKVTRYGYDRRGSLGLSSVVIPNDAFSQLFYFKPDWSGADDKGVHALIDFNSANLKYSIVKQEKELVFTLVSNGQKQHVALNSNLLVRGKFHRISAGYDFNAKKMYLSVDGQKKEDALNLPIPSAVGRGTITVGDLAGTDVYSKTQADGVLDELLVVGGYLTPDALELALTTEQKKNPAQKKGEVLNAPVKEQEKKLWELSGAEKKETATRKRITLNALWRFQLTDSARAFNPEDWIYLSVPGRYSGQANGMTDCEFFMRDKNLRPLSRTADYDRRPTSRFVNAWFERAFVADPTWKGKRIVLLLDELSRSQTGTIFLNGKELAKVDNGYFFEIPIPENRLVFGKENFLTIHAVDSGQYWAWRGIKGSIALEITNQISASYPAILTSVGKGTFQYEITLKNETASPQNVYTEANITGENAPSAIRTPGVLVNPGESRNVSVSADWKNAKLWSHETPYLYTCTFRVKNDKGVILDEMEPVRFGFREFEIRGRDYYLNGKKIHIRNHDGWANSSSDLDEARRVARTLKKLGYNAVRTNFPGEAKDNFVENIMRVCDEEGLLQMVGVDGVTGREYVLWNDPEVRKNLETRMSALIRRWRNHPSNVIWFLSSNFLGYGWDYHPLKMADGYQPAFGQNKYKVCLGGVDILRKYDASRPYFFQAGGNFGEIITSNAYFCWWPRTECNAWPEEWSKIGKKPIHIIETSFPYWASFFGMDLKYSGEKPLFYFENLARHYGPGAYASREADMIAETEKTTCGKNGTIWYDAAGYQKIKSDFLVDTLRYWRGFDMSGICPFAEIVYAFERNAPYRSSHTAKAWNVDVKDFRRFGWTPDLRKIQYQSDLVHDKPLPTAFALEKALAPKLVFIDGGAEEPVDKRANYRAGETFSKRIVLINDTMNAAEFQGKWTLGTASGSFREIVKPGEIRHVPISVVLSQVNKKTVLALKTEMQTSGIRSPEDFKVTVYPRPNVSGIGGIALYDTVGKTAKKFNELGISFKKAENLKNCDGIRMFVIGAESLTPEFMKIAKSLNLAEKIDGGKMTLFVSEQKPEALSLVGIRTVSIYARTVFDQNGNALGQWAGKSTLAPDKPLPASNTEDTVASPLWHWNNANIVASYPALRPSEGAFNILLTCGKDLIYTPLFELGSGKGKIIFNQLETFARNQSDPEADALLVSLLKQYSKTAELKSYPVFLTSGKAEDIRKKVELGANAVLSAEYAEVFGVKIQKRKIGTFDVTEAGKKYFSQLTPRDRFFRAPVEMSVFSDGGVTALTEPAFIVEKTVGKGKILFLGMASEARKEEAARGLKQGKDSSILWSVEILENRLRQLKAIAESGFGKQYEFVAQRFETMRLPVEMVDLNGNWEFRPDKDTKWRVCPVPGYYNNLLADVGTDPGFFRYRKTIELPSGMKGGALLLDLGAVDDLDVTYINGVEIGRTGEDTEGYWSARRLYPVPEKLTRSGKLTIEVVVQNLRGNGGITGHARLVKKDSVFAGSDFPYTYNKAAYHTESHIRW